MRSLATSLLLFLISGSLVADSSIPLQSVKGDKSGKKLEVASDGTLTAHGSCGESTIDISGIEKVRGNDFSMKPDGKIVIAGLNDALHFTFNTGVVDSYNGFACISTKAGDRLLVWSNCGGTACGDLHSFFIFDPFGPALLKPKNPKSGSCDANCASKTLGSQLPNKIDGGK